MPVEKREGKLELGRIGYPWQSVEGEGETWVILRARKKFDGLLIDEINRIFIEKFIWEKALDRSGKQLIKGSIALGVVFSGHHPGEEKKEFEGAEIEESLYRQLLINSQSIESKSSGNRAEDNDTQFTGLLLDGDAVALGPDYAKEKGERDWFLELPWQAWICGSPGEKEVKISKIHASQLGINTLLIEVLLRLNDLESIRPEDYGKEGFMAGYQEEWSLEVEGEPVSEVLGLTVERGFYDSSADKKSQSLYLDNCKKLTVIFISERKACERFLTAFCVTRESHNLSMADLPPVQPLSYQFYKRLQKFIKIDFHKIITRLEYYWRVIYESENLPETVAENPQEKIPVSTTQENTSLPVPRKRPGERWLQKKEGGKISPGQAKTILTIKRYLL